MNLELIAKLAQQQRQNKSPYDVAREAGFVGTREEWLASLRGPRGLQGQSAYDVAVRNGYAGTEDQWRKDLQGPKGDKGERGPIGPMPRHEWNGTELRFQMAPDKWGPFVDLKGDKGEKGDAGRAGVIGGGGPITIETNSYFPSGW